jgi:hypothetical protein
MNAEDGMAILGMLFAVVGVGVATVSPYLICNKY